MNDKTANGIQAVILAAGKGTRMLPLTETRPKPMLEVLGKNLIEWKLDTLPPEVTEVVIVVGYLGNVIREYFGNEWKGRQIRYVEQIELNGTWGALKLVQPLLTGRFLVMMGDDLYDAHDILRVLERDRAIGVSEAHDREIAWELTSDVEGHFAGIRQEKHHIERGYINTGFYVLDTEIFNETPILVEGSTTEMSLPHTLLAAGEKKPIALVPMKHWMQITSPEDLIRAEGFVTNK